MAGFAAQQLINARKEAAAGTAGAKEAVERLEAAQKANEPKTTTPGTIIPKLGSASSSTRDDSGFETTTVFNPDTGRYTRSDNSAQLASAALAEQQAAQERLVEAQRRGNIESLRGAEATALGATGRQREKTVEEAFGQRRGIKTQAKQSERTLAQYLASRGLGRSGAAVGGQIAQNVTLQEGIAQARGQESSRLGDIGQAETDIRTQTASGIAQAGQQAEAQRAQLEIANIQQRAQQAQQTQQLQASRDFEEQQFQRNQNADIAAEQRQQDFERAQAEIDLAIDEARRTQDFAREDQLLEMKQQNAITLKQTVGGGTRSSGGSGGLSFSQDRTVFNDQVKQGLSGVEARLDRIGGTDEFGGRIDPTGEQQTTEIFNYLRQLEQQGIDQSVIDAIARNYGVNIQDQRLQPLTQGGITGGVRLPTFGGN